MVIWKLASGRGLSNYNSPLILVEISDSLISTGTYSCGEGLSVISTFCPGTAFLSIPLSILLLIQSFCSLFHGVSEPWDKGGGVTVSLRAEDSPSPVIFNPSTVCDCGPLHKQVSLTTVQRTFTCFFAQQSELLFAIPWIRDQERGYTQSRS